MIFPSSIHLLYLKIGGLVIIFKIFACIIIVPGFPLDLHRAVLEKKKKKIQVPSWISKSPRMTSGFNAAFLYLSLLPCHVFSFTYTLDKDFSQAVLDPVRGKINLLKFKWHGLMRFLNTLNVNATATYDLLKVPHSNFIFIFYFYL